MDHEQIRLKLKDSFTTLTVPVVTVLNIEGPYLTVSVISDSFNGKNFLERVRALTELLKANASEVWDNYTLIFKAETKAESRQRSNPDDHDKEDIDVNERLPYAAGSHLEPL